MTIIELGALGEFLGSVLTLATLVYLAVQIRQNTAQQKREELVSIQHGQNSVLAQLRDPRVCGAFVRGAAGANPSIADRATAQNWVIQYLNHFQVVHDLHRNRALDEETYQLWAGFAVAMGFLLGGIQAYTGSLVGPIVAHVVINTVNLRKIGRLPISA